MAWGGMRHSHHLQISLSFFIDVDFDAFTPFNMMHWQAGDFKSCLWLFLSFFFLLCHFLLSRCIVVKVCSSSRLSVLTCDFAYCCRFSIAGCPFFDVFKQKIYFETKVAQQKYFAVLLCLFLKFSMDSFAMQKKIY